jgi:hypothetical protein
MYAFGQRRLEIGRLHSATEYMAKETFQNKTLTRTGKSLWMFTWKFATRI